MNQEIKIVEVAPRDGLQNETAPFNTTQKIELINRSIAAGLRRIEVASFVHPRLVPQMSDAEAVLDGLSYNNGVVYSGLVLNERGLVRALDTAVHEIAVVAVASDTFAGKNQNQTAKQSAQAARELVKAAKAAGRRATVTIGASWGCPFEGEVPTEWVVELISLVDEGGPDEIAFADTIGVADPWAVTGLLGAARQATQTPLRCHFHNTRNTGLANAHAAILAGVRIFDASLGGIGGCPFAPRATGNIPTEDLFYMLQRGGYKTGLDLTKLVEAAVWLDDSLEGPIPGMLSKAGGFPKEQAA